jgi:hypothetical protein
MSAQAAAQNTIAKKYLRSIFFMIC